MRLSAASSSSAKHGHSAEYAQHAPQVRQISSSGGSKVISRRSLRAAGRRRAGPPDVVLDLPRVFSPDRAGSRAIQDRAMIA
jgi:hypothetical protein